MPARENQYTLEQLCGNVEVVRNTSPTIRATNRRSDPSGTISAPFYMGLADKKLTVEYSATNPADPPLSTTITFDSDDYAAALEKINTVAPVFLASLDQDGFLTLQSKSVGGSHYLKVLKQAVAGEDAATTLGFEVDPYPGSVSFAGEIASAPGVRRQRNPQGTALIGHDEDLTAASLNRAFLSLLRYTQFSKIDFDREVAVVQEIAVNLLNNASVAAADGVTIDASLIANVAVLTASPTIRLASGFFGTTINPSARALEEVFKLIHPTTGSDLILDPEFGGGRYRIRSVHYSAAGSAASAAYRTLQASGFSVWGTPDNKSIFGQPQKDKHPAVAITDIRGGNVVFCTGATFVTKLVQPGDTFYITGATDDFPFNHNGEFVVETVVSEEVLTVRPKSANETKVLSTAATPTELNSGSGMGSASVPMGFSVPASSIVCTLEKVGGVAGWGLKVADFPTAKLLVKSMVPLRTVTAQAFAREFNISIDVVLEYIDKNIETVVEYIDEHISDGGHDVDSISWASTPPKWARTTEDVFPAGSSLEGVIRSIITMLGDNDTSPTVESGASRVGAAPITGSPNSLTAGTLMSQIQTLLGLINSHVSNGGIHVGGVATYSGSPAWKDGSVVPAGLSIDGAIDRIVTDLGQGVGGAARIGVATRTSWLGGRTNISGAGTDHILAAFNKIITDLGDTVAGDDGSERIGAANINEATGTLIPGNSVRSQLDYLATNWGKLNRTNSWIGAANIFNSAVYLNGLSGDGNAAFESLIGASGDRKLLWKIGITTPVTCFYYTSSKKLEIVFGATWTPVSNIWSSTAGVTCYKYVLNGAPFSTYSHPGSGTWPDSAWTLYVPPAGGGATGPAGPAGPSGPAGPAGPEEIKAAANFITNGSGGFGAYGTTRCGGQWMTANRIIVTMNPGVSISRVFATLRKEGTDPPGTGFYVVNPYIAGIDVNFYCYFVGLPGFGTTMLLNPQTSHLALDFVAF